jgi:hypothetical protein
MAAHYAWHALDILGRLDVSLHIVEAMGGTKAMIASAMTTPFFGLALVLGGVAYTVFVGEPKKGVQGHPFWPYVGWAVFAVCLTAMILVPLYGGVELYIRREIAKGRQEFPETPQIHLCGNRRSIQRLGN